MIPKLAQNIISLYLVHIVRLVLPLVLMPLLTRRVSADVFGLYIFTISLGAWLSLFVEYGFNISGTKDIAVVKEGAKQTKFVSGVYSGKILLLLALCPFVIGVYFLLPLAYENPYWLCAAVISAICSGFMPVFYFQGVENAKPLAVIEVVLGVVFVGVIFHFVNSDADSTAIPAAIMVSRILALLLGLWLLIKKLGIRCLYFSANLGFSALLQGKHCFVLQALTALYTSFNVVLLGYWVNVTGVAVYGASERLLRAGLGFIGQASNALFPRVARLQNEDVKRFNMIRLASLLVFTLLGFLGVVVTHVLAPRVVPWLFNNQLNQAIEVVNVLAWVIPAIAISNVLGFQFLLLERKEKYLNAIIACGGVLNVGLAFILVPKLGYIGMAWSWLVVEWVISLSLICFVLYMHRQFVWRFASR